MKSRALPFVFSAFTLLLLVAGCMEPPLQEPTVTVSEIALSDVSLQAMTVNTTVVIFNPNPVGANLDRVAFDVYYGGNAENYLGHGEINDIDVKESGNTTVVIPVTIANIPALKAIGSLVRDGFITLRVNGSASIDLAVTSYELPFARSEEFRLSEFANLVPAASGVTGSMNVTEKLEQAKGIWDAFTG
jgi:LEA14-like dessication related protein